MKFHTNLSTVVASHSKFSIIIVIIVDCCQEKRFQSAEENYCALRAKRNKPYKVEKLFDFASTLMALMAANYFPYERNNNTYIFHRLS
jgi:hypothetical protein